MCEKLEEMFQNILLREDAKDFLRRLVTRDNPFIALTVREIGGIIPTRFGNKRDRELVRKKIATPLVELGCLEKVTRTKKDLILGHPISNSPNCAYRLTREFWDMVFHGKGHGNTTFQRCVEIHAIQRGTKSTHEALMDACVEHLAELFMGESVLVYRDPPHGPRVNLDDLFSLSVLGLEMNPRDDPCPDLIFWTESTNKLWIVEAVTTEGIIDNLRKQRLEAWVRRGNDEVLIQYITAFVSWKVAASFMAHVGQNTNVWVQESPFTLWTCCSK